MSAHNADTSEPWEEWDAARNKGRCPVCGKWIGILVCGELRYHGHPARRCRGSRAPWGIVQRIAAKYGTGTQNDGSSDDD